MSHPAYRFEFGPDVPADEAEMSLHLAMIAVEGLFGRPAVRLDARYRLLEPQRAIAVDCSSPVGAALVRVFAALLIKEFGDDVFQVRRMGNGSAEQPPPVAHTNVAAREQSAGTPGGGTFEDAEALAAA